MQFDDLDPSDPLERVALGLPAHSEPPAHAHRVGDDAIVRMTVRVAYSQAEALKRLLVEGKAGAKTQSHCIQDAIAEWIVRREELASHGPHEGERLASARLEAERRVMRLAEVEAAAEEMTRGARRIREAGGDTPALEFLQASAWKFYNGITENWLRSRFRELIRFQAPIAKLWDGLELSAQAAEEEGSSADGV